MYRRISYRLVMAMMLIAPLSLAQGRANLPDKAWKRRMRAVMSADTLVIENGEALDEVRLVCIKTPQLRPSGQPHEYMAKEARSFVQREIMGKEVYIVFDNPRNEPRRDRDARLMAYVYYEKKVEAASGAEPSSRVILLNAELIRRGMAKVDTSYGCSKRYRLNALQREARRDKKGVWAIPPQ